MCFYSPSYQFSFLSFPALVGSVQSMSLSVTSAQTAAWRQQIFEQLTERTKREMDNFKHYEQAIEQVMQYRNSCDCTMYVFSLMYLFFCLPVVLPLYLILFFINHSSDLNLTLNAVCVGEERNHAVVEGLEAIQVDRCSFCPGAVLRTRGQQGRHSFHLLQLLWREEGEQEVCVG